ncbi:MAG: cupin domain-containing protein [Candidatus Hydrogenedentes bacterium]|nr:cupin domain-containing protein [Candidatus Hydrogenedentota bacterium]
MERRTDFARREVVLPGCEAWWSSPMAGAERYILDRVGEKIARETSIIRYEAGARVTAHAHDGGEEFLVLAGSFHDDNGDYPEATYVRDPIRTAHASWAGPDGAVLFLKLHQFAAADSLRVVIDTRTARWYQGVMPGLTVLPLHEHGPENVALVRWEPSTRFIRHHHWGGEEILVLSGVFEDEHGMYPKGSWLRSPHLSEHDPFTGPEGALIYVKTGHLAPA